MRARFVLAFAAMACSSTPGLAHAFLQRADPAAGTSFPLARAPKRVSLTLSEKLEPAFSGLAVTDSSGRNMAAAPVTVGGSSMIAPLRSLRPGRYRVVWHAVSVDTHRTEGAYSFTVKP